ncbi:SDR family oxidoreductase [Roseiconus nitratireducens]|uniref:SDR family oxidoreductase n=1 Tax=Roseiconus nitratireducens TaxID=2605748 RepID=A0A5M6D316_9BACT|nr:SDR family oxidoreductase [Roseiconus nitratireducens]KAA5541871.1 SDR family oxidoreductase [Roseiconus nitratireducens]
MAFHVENKNVLVTGANRGIGRAIVEGALQRGAAKVYAAVRDLDSAQPLVAQAGDKVVPIRVDLSDEASIRAAATQAGDVDLVINNAGVLKTEPALSENAIDALRFELDVNVFGLLRVAQAFAPVLASRPEAAFVQLNSVASMKSFSDFATYSASKAAAYSLTQALRDQLGAQGTQVVSVHPGPIATDMGHQAGLDEIAEPPSLVADAIFAALENDDFHAWPDTMAKQFSQPYQPFAENVVEADMQEDPA